MNNTMQDPVRYLFGDPLQFLCQWLTQLDPTNLTSEQQAQLRTSLDTLTSKLHYRPLGDRPLRTSMQWDAWTNQHGDMLDGDGDGIVITYGTTTDPRNCDPAVRLLILEGTPEAEAIQLLEMILGYIKQYPRSH